MAFLPSFRLRSFKSLGPTLVFLTGSVFFLSTLAVARNETTPAVTTEEAKNSTEQTKIVLNRETIDLTNPVPECNKALSENGLFKEVYEILAPWVVKPETKADSLPRAVEICRMALENLNRVSEIDSFLEETVAAHPNDWRVLTTVARQYGSLGSYGVMKDGKFIRGDTGGALLFSTERDRIRNLQLMADAMPLLEKERTDGRTTPSEVFEFYRSFAASVIGNYEMDAWRLQCLTELTRLPDYDSDDNGRGWRDFSFAPVDENGTPIYYSIPNSFDTAQNDGERWRFLLKKASESGAEDVSDVELVFADFLREQFGPETLAHTPLLARLDSDNQEIAEGIGSLTTLADNETIARLANGVKRFPLPDDQNYLQIYRKIMDASTNENLTLLRNRQRAAETLGQEFLNRRQFNKAEEIYRTLAELETALPEEERTAKTELDRIVGNYGAFDPTQTKVAETDASFSWRFRNGKSVRFLIHEINVRQLLNDVKESLLECEKNPPKEWNPEKTNLENIGWKLLNDPSSGQKYLGQEVANWTVDLSPAPDHRNQKVTIPFPIHKAGAYLLRGKMENGNSDAIVLWLSDTALLKKQLDGRTLWFVADARTGAPIEGVNLHFFGYSMRRQAWLRHLKNDALQNNTRKLEFKTEQFTAQTDANGFYYQKPSDPTTDRSNDRPRFQWLVEATTNGENADGRFAYYGFNGIWFERKERSDFENTRAYFISDRPIYRPTDSIHYKFWVGTAKYDLPETWTWAGKSARLTIVGPGGTTLVKKEIILDEAGGFEDVLETDANFKLGSYSFQLSALVESTNGGSKIHWQNLGGGDVRLEEYKKPEFEVTVDAPSEPIKLGDSFKAKIKANYYFGSPVTNARVLYSVTRTAMTQKWFPARPWDWLYGNGYGWLASDASWFPGWSKWGVPRPTQPWFPSLDGPPEVVLKGETEIGEDGTAEIAIDSALAKMIYPDNDQRYEITAEVTDASRRTIIGNGTVLVAKEPFKIYAWTERGFYGPNQQIDVSFQTRRLDGKPVVGDAEITVYRIRYETDSEAGDVVKPIETEVFSQKTTTDTDGKGHSSFTLADAGQYRFACVVTDSKGNRREGGTLLTVYGKDSVLASPETFHSNPLEIIPEKAEYQTGETVRLKLNSAAPDSTILLFLRSENGIASSPEILRTDGPETIYEFTLTDADQPNLFIEAVMIRDGHFYQETKEIAVPPAKRVLNVTVTPDKKDYKPGEEATMKVVVTDSDGKPVIGEIVAAIYDRSLDALAGSTISDLKEFFWNWKRHHYPQNDHSLEKVFHPIDFPNKKMMTPLGAFGDFSIEFAETEPDSMVGGGGNGMKGERGVVSLLSKAAPLAANGSMRVTDEKLNEAAPARDESFMDGAPDTAMDTGSREAESPTEATTVRKDFADTALWVGRLQTDENGACNLLLTMPENLTAWKTRVWSFAPGTRVGEGSAETVTRKRLILRMQRPRFLTQTDKILLSANVHNYFDQEKRVAVSLEIDPEAKKRGEDSVISLIEDGRTGLSQRIVTIPAGGEARVDWEVEAKKEGIVPLVMKAQSDEELDGIEESIPILIHGILKQSAVSGMISNKSDHSTDGSEGKSQEATWTITVPEKRIPEQTSFTVRFSPTLAGAMIDALPYLTDYPYGCSEQTLNRFVPTVLTQKLLTELGVDLTSFTKKRANLNAQELGDTEVRRKLWNQRRNIFGELASENGLEETVSENPVFDPVEVARRVSKGVERLAELQNGDGGWGWFGGWGERSDAHLTALITEGLLLARQSGAEIPDEMIDRGRVWLEKRLTRETEKLANGEQWSEDAKKEAPSDWKATVSAEDVLVYRVLSEMESHNDDLTGTLTRMKDFIWRDRAKLTPYALTLYGLALTEKSNDVSDVNADRIAMTVRILRQYLKLDETNQTAWLDLPGASGENPWEWWSWSGDEIETQAAFLRLLVRTEPNGETAPLLVKYLLNNRKNATYWRSTRDTALCLAAFAEFIRVTGETTGSQMVEILVDGVTKKQIEITPENLFMIDNTFEMNGEELTAGNHSVTIRTHGNGPLYYNSYLANFTLEDFIPKTGLEVGVTRRYWKLIEDDSATEVVAGGHGQLVHQRVKKFRREPIEIGQTLQSGDLIEVELLVTSKNDYESFLIEDRKPAGFEAVAPVSGYNGNQLDAYVEFRDARVCFFVHRLERGDYSLTYRLRAETPGSVSALPATIRGMYAPELKGNSDEFKTRVE